MTKFIQGIQLNEMFFKEIIQSIIETDFPDLEYSAGLIGSGSEVLGFDTVRSTDHDWGLRFILFLNKEDLRLKANISRVLSEKLPPTFRGYSTHFGMSESGSWTALNAKKGELIQHRIDIFTIQSFFEDYLGINPYSKLSEIDWLVLSEQKLKTIESGKIFHDQLGLDKIRKKFSYYPKDIWLYLLASEWQKIGQEEPFVGRCGDADDELGSRVIATRLVHSIMRICFLMEKVYVPYSKWFGTAFSKLKCAKKISPILHKVMSSENWKDRQKHLSSAYEEIAKMHNRLGITKKLPTKASCFWDRPYLVIHGDIFAKEIRSKIRSKAIRNIKAIGSVNQISNSVDLLENNSLLNKMKNLYK